MKYVFIIFSFLSFSCQQSDNTIDSNESSDTIRCENSVHFGQVEICLPIIDGMVECYSNPSVKKKANEYNPQGNSILAFYLNNSTFEKVDELEHLSFDDYFQVYVVDQMKDIRVGNDEMDEMSSIIEGNYFKENWDNIKAKIEQGQDFLSVGRPILIENYTPNKRVRTYVMLTKYLFGGEEKVLLTSMNLLEIKKRLIWLVYYKNYDGEESIRKAKAKNDYITLQFIDENK